MSHERAAPGPAVAAVRQRVLTDPAVWHGHLAQVPVYRVAEGHCAGEYFFGKKFKDGCPVFCRKGMVALRLSRVGRKWWLSIQDHGWRNIGFAPQPTPISGATSSHAAPECTGSAAVSNADGSRLAVIRQPARSGAVGAAEAMDGAADKRDVADDHTPLELPATITDWSGWNWWTNSAEPTSSINRMPPKFELTPEFRDALSIFQPWSVSLHRRVSRHGQRWVINLFLCNRRLLRQRAECLASGCSPNELLPNLPLEMWFAVLAQLTIREIQG
eukprot:m.471409 g.471409  ORF g.471409 m.471409 type:complete len:273 (+) comp31024_c0_seq1:201-1019(+)